MTSPSSNKKNNVGLVIGSGGVKALGITALFDLLDKNQLKPELVIGCSGGSVLSSNWASGSSVAELETFITEYHELIKNEIFYKKIDYRTLLSLANYPGGQFNRSSGLLKNEWLLDFLRRKMGSKRIENSPIKSIVMATDLETGEPVPLHEGLLSECIYASSALYPILPPIYLNNRWLVDGAYFSANPILQASKMNCGKIISVSFEEAKSENYNSFFEFYMEFVSQLMNKNARKQNSFTINFHHDEILFINCYFDRSINFWDVDYLPYINEVTTKTIEKNKNQILDFFSC